jgi:hypothetical protein
MSQGYESSGVASWIGDSLARFERLLLILAQFLESDDTLVSRNTRKPKSSKTRYASLPGNP